MSWEKALVAAVDADEPAADGVSFRERFAAGAIGGGYDEEAPHRSLVAWLDRAGVGLKPYVACASAHPRVPWLVLVGVPVVAQGESVPVAEAAAAVSEATAFLRRLGHDAMPTLWLVHTDPEEEPT